MKGLGFCFVYFIVVFGDVFDGMFYKMIDIF